MGSVSRGEIGADESAPTTAPPRSRGLARPARMELALLALIMLAATALRLYRLDVVPPGLTHDEAANGQSALGILEGERPIYFTVANGREPLYAYSMAPLIATLGPTEISVRLTSVLWGLALILVTWAWARRAFDPGVALLAAGGLSVGFWPLMISRLGLRAGTLPVLFTAAVYCCWRAAGWYREHAQASTQRAAWAGYALAGLLLGAAFYSYMASRILPVVLVLFALYLAVFHREQARAEGPGLLAVALVAILLAMPLFRYLSAHPDAETRIDQLAEPWRQAVAGNWRPLGENAVAAIKIFTFGGAGDPHWIYNISGRPLLEPLSGLLFYAGVLLALARWRDPVHFFGLTWLVVGLVPVLVTGANSSVVRAVAALPAVFVIQGLALRKLADQLIRRRAHLAGYVVPGVLVFIIGLVSAHTYFVRWPRERDVRVAYHTTLAEIARHLDEHTQGSTAVISSLYPGFFHDPYSFDLLSQREELHVRWFDARSALVIPAVAQAYAVFPALAPLDEALASFFPPQAQLVDRVELRADDLNPWFEIYRWQPQAAMGRVPATMEVDVGQVATLLGYQLLTPSVPPGGTVQLITFWRALRAGPKPPQPELVMFVHALDSDGQVVGQQDRLDAPAWNWSPGDMVLQLHRFSLQEDVPEGLYALEVGLYLQAEGYPRLPVVGGEGARAGDDSIRLSEIEVRAP